MWAEVKGIKEIKSELLSWRVEDEWDDLELEAGSSFRRRSRERHGNVVGLFFFFFPFLYLYLWHLEVPWPGVESDLQL